jgi:hypothetical protein
VEYETPPVIPAIIGATGIVTKGLKNICKILQEGLDRLFTKKLYYGHST